MSELPFGIDISKYQYSADGKQKPNFDTINATCAFVAVRAGISWGYTDPWFAYSWEHLDVPRLAYHVVYPGKFAEPQMTHFLNIVQPGEHDRLVLDLELDHGYSKARITKTVNDCLAYILSNTGRYPIIYSRAGWVNQFLEVSDLPELDWWLAGYRKRLPSPLFTAELDPKYLAIPKGVAKEHVKIHQTGEKGNGKKYGVQSYYIDTNRFLGTREEMRAWFGVSTDVPEPDPEPPVVEPDKPLYRVKITWWATPYVNLRSEPRIAKNTDIGDIYPNEIVNVFEEKQIESDLWVRSERGWLQAKYTERIAGEAEPGHIPGLLVVPHYSQNDPRWKNDYLGYSKTTMGNFGCLITAVAAYMTYLGETITPGELNNLLIMRGGFTGNRYYWQMPDKIWRIQKPEDYGFSTGTGFEKALDKILADDRPALAMVDYVPGGAFDQHWVLILGKVNGVYWLLDTWDGTVQALNAKYKKIFRLVGYKR